MWQNRTFPPTQPPSQPEPLLPPSRLSSLRRSLGKFYQRWQMFVFIGLGILIAFVAFFIYDLTRPQPQHLTQQDINNAVAHALASATPTPSYESQVYAIIQPSVVSIEAKVPGKDGKVRDSIGTGVVVDDTGNILTCLHVINNASEIDVTFADGTESKASVTASQPENDMAVLYPEVIPDNLVPATLAGSSMLNVGDQVVCRWKSFWDYVDSLSSGVVSGLGRTFKSPDTGLMLSNVIQFDAAVNPGNSGGPLVDRNGEVVGIVDALINPTGQDVFIGIGFAVTIETAASALGSPWY